MLLAETRGLRGANGYGVSRRAPTLSSAKEKGVNSINRLSLFAARLGKVEAQLAALRP
jgi:hypothetical protein